MSAVKDMVVYGPNMLRVSPAVFGTALERFRAASYRNRQALAPWNDALWAGRPRCFYTADLAGGFAVLTDGTLVGVHSWVPHRGDELVAAAVERGADKLTCFDVGPLRALYQRHGFVVVTREEYRPMSLTEHAPATWNHVQDKLCYACERPDFLTMER